MSCSHRRSEHASLPFAASKRKLRPLSRNVPRLVVQSPEGALLTFYVMTSHSMCLHCQTNKRKQQSALLRAHAPCVSSPCASALTTGAGRALHRYSQHTTGVCYCILTFLFLQ